MILYACMKSSFIVVYTHRQVYLNHLKDLWKVRPEKNFDPSDTFDYLAHCWAAVKDSQVLRIWTIQINKQINNNLLLNPGGFPSSSVLSSKTEY